MKKRISFKKYEQGFTLIEIMVVIVILGILAMYIGPKLMGRTDDAKIVQAKIQIKGLETSLNLYKLDMGVYPTSDLGLRALVEPQDTGTGQSNWNKNGYLEKNRIPKDPWKNDYVYISPGTHGDFDLISYGADGAPGGDGSNRDINNWEIE